MGEEGPLARWLSAWVDGVRRRAVLTIAICGALTAGAGFHAASTLGINSDTIQLFPEDLPARRNHDAFVALFPNLENALLIVVDGETPELARGAVERLSQYLSRDTQHFSDVYLPDGGLFFEQNALLYRSVEELERFGDQLGRIQPVVAELERDGSIANLAALVETGLQQIGEGQEDAALWSEILDRISRATTEVYGEYPIAVSWEEVLLRGSSIETVTRRLIVAHPVLDFGEALPAAGALEALRKAARTLALAPERGVIVRVTGNPALTHEETLSLTYDIGVAGIFCLLIVCGVLTIALRSVKLVAAAVGTLLVGLIWTASFAGWAVGDLNVISVAAGVLFLGLGVDFGIHLGMHYADLLQRSEDHAYALRETTATVGGSIVLCTFTTAIGFFAFLPTDFRGVAELGLITGVGLFIILFLTLTLLPALLSAGLRVNVERLRGRDVRFAGGRFRLAALYLESHARTIRWAALAVGIGGAVLIPGLRFDANIVAMRDPSTESVQTFNDLLAEAGSSSPWYANSVVADLQEADAIKARLAELAEVERAISLTDYIPEDQEEKLEILADIAFFMDSSGVGRDDVSAQLSTVEQVAALRRLHDFLSETLAVGAPASGRGASSDLRSSILELHDKLAVFLVRVDEEGDADFALRELEQVLLSSLPEQIRRLHRGLATTGVARSDLPPRLVDRMMASDGRARVQAFPAENLEQEASFSRFVDGVRTVDPNATGVAVNLVEFARTTRQAFGQALLGAALVIAGLLWILWRNLREVFVALAPLALSAVLTAAAMVALGFSLNFFNVIVIPLLMGAGVDSAIHLVERSRTEELGEGGLLETTTARAVFFSALTTIVSFGSLALSSHVGLAGLGTLLTVGMGVTVVCNLVVLPALLRIGKKQLVRR